MKFKKPSLKKILMYVITLVVLILLAVGIVFFARRKKKTTYVRQTPLVSVVKPEQKTISETITIPSYIESNVMSPVVTFVSGRVLSLDVDAGETVEKDQILVRLLPEGYADVKAPLSGRVLTTLVKNGDMVEAGTPVAIIGDLNDLCVNVNVPEKYIADIKVGQKAFVTHKNTKLTKNGTVALIEPYVNPISKTFKVKVQLDEVEEAWAIPGSAVDCSIVKSVYENAFTVPRSCLSSSDRLYIVKNGKSICLTQTEFVGDDNDVIVPKGEENSLFIIRGQNKVFSDETVDYEWYGSEKV